MNTTTKTNPATSTKPQSSKVDAASLAPDFDRIPDEVRAHQHTFWLGVTADCPRGQIDVAGLSFQKMQERISVDITGKQTRIPEFGVINKTVTRRKFDALVKALPHLIIRPYTDREGKTPAADQPTKLAKGRLIKIPDAQAIEAARKAGKELRPYVRRPGDRPATEFMYFLHAPSGHRAAGGVYQTIAETGLEWPDDAPSSE